MSEPFLGEIRVTSWNFAPKGWALCNGQVLQINASQALFSILGTTYGGDGRTTFALPNLQGRVPFHVGNARVLGETGGEANHTLSSAELPTHNHLPRASGDAAAALAPPVNNLWATTPNVSEYTATPPNAGMSPNAIANAGGSQAHGNLSPYLVLSFIIALQGIFPSRN